jgi:hypothetical protein
MKMKLDKIIGAVGLFFLTVVLINIGLHLAWHLSGHDPKAAPADVFQILAASIIITWILLVIGYYIWAIRFYCINLGWTDADWAAKSGNPVQAEALGDMSKATSVNVDTVEPDQNPNKEQSMGLPEGTVRATIALSMLVAGLAMTIASFSMNNTFPLNALFIDHYEFFKTGFLMMIAFYFGSKSLDILRKTNNAAIITKGDSATVKVNTTVTAAPDAEDATNPNSGGDTLSQANPFTDPTARG